MSVLIKGMKKPKNCCFIIDGKVEVCPFVSTNDDCVLQLGENCYETWEEQYASCPLVELPEKYGDLIDKQSLLKELVYIGDFLTSIGVKFIRKSQTVIEAEGNNESPKSPLADIKPKEIPTMKHTYEYHGG